MTKSPVKQQQKSPCSLKFHRKLNNITCSGSDVRGSEACFCLQDVNPGRLRSGMWFVSPAFPPFDVDRRHFSRLRVSALPQQLLWYVSQPSSQNRHWGHMWWRLRRLTLMTRLLSVTVAAGSVSNMTAATRTDLWGGEVKKFLYVQKNTKKVCDLNAAHTGPEPNQEHSNERINRPQNITFSYQTHTVGCCSSEWSGGCEWWCRNLLFCLSQLLNARANPSKPSSLLWAWTKTMT